MNSTRSKRLCIGILSTTNMVCMQYVHRNAELCSSLIAHLRYILTYAVFPSIDGTSTYGNVKKAFRMHLLGNNIKF